jgi:hypothetical protein
MFLEKLHDVQQTFQLSDSQLKSILMISPHNSALKELLQRIENLDISFVLYDSEFRQDLVSHLHFRMLVDADVKAPFAIHESDNPVRRNFHDYDDLSKMKDAQRTVSEDPLPLDREGFLRIVQSSPFLLQRSSLRYE